MDRLKEQVIFYLNVIKKYLMANLLLFLSLGLLYADTSIEIDEHFISSPEIQLSKSTHLEGWLDDIEKAKRVALEQNKPILIAFLGPNWCQWSDKLEEEILTSPLFLEGIKNEVVLVKVDFPQDIANHESENVPSLKLKDRYCIQKCPSLILIDASGEQIAKLEDVSMKSEEYVRCIKSVLGDFRQMTDLAKKGEIESLNVDDLRSFYTKAGKLADQTFKKALLKEGLKADQSPYFLLEEYRDCLSAGKMKERKVQQIREKIVKRDPNNEQGAQLQLAILDFKALSNILENQKKIETVIKPLTEYLHHFGSKDTENSWKVEMMIAQYLFGKNEVKGALEHAEASFKRAPDAAKEEVSGSIKYLKTHLH